MLVKQDEEIVAEEVRIVEDYAQVRWSSVSPSSEPLHGKAVAHRWTANMY